MGLNYKKILDVKISIITMEKVLEETRKYLEKSKIQYPKSKKNNKKPFIIFTPNPEIITFAQKDEVFKQIVNSAQINIPDGAGVIWALNKINRLKIRPVTGADLMENLCEKAAVYGYRIGTIGASVDLAVDMAERLRKIYKKLKIVTLDDLTVKIINKNFMILDNNGKEFDKKKYFANLLDEIKKKKIDILFVALGFPKQEYFIENVKIQMSRSKTDQPLAEKYQRPLVMMGVGGSFDYLSGRISRAPLWMREKGLEWLYRLIKEPWRIKRQYRGSEFFLRVLFS